MDVLQKCQNLKDKYHFLTDAHALYIRSIIARYEDDYELEKNIVAQAIALYPENAYFQERVRWHALPYFEKYEARKTPPLPDDYVPVAQEYRDQLTIVVNCSDDSFYETYELIESIRNTKYYDNVKIEILDLNTQLQFKEQLSSKLGIYKFHNAFDLFEKFFGKPYDHSWIDLKNPTHPNVILCCIMESFTPRFIESPYIFHMESDIWIQDEKLFDAYFKSAIQNAVSVIQHPWPGPIEKMVVNFLRETSYFQKFTSSLRKSTAFEICYFCYHRNFAGLSKAQKEWLTVKSCPKFFEFLVKNYSYRVSGLQDYHILPMHYHFFLNKAAVMNEDGFFIDPFHDNKIIGSAHYGGSPKERYYNIPIEKIATHGKKSTIQRSARYRDLPWRDKQSLEQIINLEEL